jgi:hypothetical protein
MDTSRSNPPTLHHSIVFMAKAHPDDTDSAYYPPRARWYSPVFYLGYAFRRHLWLDRVQVRLPGNMTFVGAAASFLVPGMGLYLRRPRIWGYAAWLGYALMLLLFIAAFGYPLGNFALGLLISIHVTGFVFYCKPFWQQAELQSRLAFVLLGLLAIGLLIYLPLRMVILHRWWLPLRLNDQVVVVERQFPTNAIQRGDWVAYRFGGNGALPHGVWIRSGINLGQVLALAGDSVKFSTNGCAVNGTLYPLRPYMPHDGELTVPENHWFIWPDVGIRVRDNRGMATSVMLQVANVPRTQYMGKPFDRWLWRRQKLP